MEHAFGADVGDVLIGLVALGIAVGGVIWLLVALMAGGKKGRRAISSGGGRGLSEAEVDAVVVATVAATVATVASATNL